MRIFVTGAHGQIARSLLEAASGRSDIVLGFGARPNLDLAQPETILPLMEAFAPDVVINPAAYTAVDKAESEAALAMAINKDGAEAVALAAKALGAPVLHFSTDYVFDGTKQGAYVETDPTSPTGAYGRSKLEGEIAVAGANDQHVILRTAWVYAPFGANFVRTMLRLASERDALSVVADQIGCPTYAPDIAQASLAIAELILQTGWQPQYRGITHLAGPRALSWCEFAQAIINGAAARGLRDVPVKAITTADYPTPARRPANSRLATKRLTEVFGAHLPPFDTSFERCLDRLIGPPLDARRSSS